MRVIVYNMLIQIPKEDHCYDYGLLKIRRPLQLRA